MEYNSKPKMVISASASHSLAINKWLKYWEGKGFDVVKYPALIKSENLVSDWPNVHEDFYKSLFKADCHFIANEDKNGIAGYIGVGVFAELAFTTGLNFSKNKKIKILLCKMPDCKSAFYKDIKLWLDQGWIKIFNGEVV